MKKIVYLLLVSFMLLMSSCDNDDDYTVSGKSLAQTTWKATCTIYNSSENNEFVYHYMLQFLTDTNGTYANLEDPYTYSLEKFSYDINKRIITFHGFFEGNWTIMDASKGKITLQGYFPERCVLLLEKQY